MGKTLGLDKSVPRREVVRLLRWSGTEFILYLMAANAKRLTRLIIMSSLAVSLLITHTVAILLEKTKCNGFPEAGPTIPQQE